jgi:glycosyltransferase involved in cell wall biosynthesis
MLGGPEDDLVTVAIPVRNEEATIERCLASVRSQTYANLQVIVVDGESTDATQDVVKRIMAEDPRVELLVNPKRIVPSSLNLALAAARGEWWVRNDGHSTIPPDYVERAVAHLRTGRWGGVAGRKDAVADTDAGRAVAAALGSPFGVGNSTYHHGTTLQVVDHIPFGTYPVAVLRELGGWDEDMVTNQDYEFDYRVRRSGRELLFDPELHIDWRCPQSIGAFWRQYRRYGRGKVNTLVRHPESGAVRHYVAPALVASLVAGVLLLPFRRTRRLGAVPFAAYGAGIVAATAVTAPRVRGARARALLPAAFAAMHVGWGVGFWEELARVRRELGPRAVVRIFRRGR